MRLLDAYKVPVFQETKHDQLNDGTPSSAQLTSTTPRFAEAHTRLMSVPFSPTLDTGRLKAHDRDLKRRIRVLKVASRILAVILSIATLIPLLMTIAKYVSTRNSTYTVDGQTRTAWARNTITAYTYSYAAIIGTSLVLNTAVLCGYCRKNGIRSANRVSKIATTWTWSVIAVDIVMLGISVSVYRYGKEPVDGKFRDLWGWTCSSAARDLQGVLTSVDFDYHCTVQSSFCYTGIAGAIAEILSAILLTLAIKRKRSKKLVRRATLLLENDRQSADDAVQYRGWEVAHMKGVALV